MALSSSLLLLNTSPSPLSLYAYQSHSRAFLQKQSYSCFCVQNRIKPFRLPITNKAQVDVRKEDIVIVGAGIAGLAAAVSLHRLGIGSLVLEQAESLLAGGTSLTLFKNGWRVLDAIGIGNDLRTQFLEIQC